MSRSSKRGAEAASGGPLITLTTDFGTRDGYVAAIKGRILALCGAARLLDLSHAIPPQDLWAAGRLLARAVPEFPPRTIHLAVVDPGVGSARRALVIRAGAGGAEQLLVGPDNGLLWPAVERLGGSWQAWEVVTPPTAVPNAESGGASHTTEGAEATTERWCKDATFDGLALFAPVAAWLARGMEPPEVGPTVRRLRRLKIGEAARRLEPTGGQAVGRGQRLVAEGRVEFFDHFGNAVTNIPGEWFGEGTTVSWKGQGATGDETAAVGREMPRLPLVTHFAAVPPGAGLALVGSSGRLELAIRDGSARQILGLSAGDRVRVWG
jgi:S-adenosylmethionine hydrolase